MELIIAILFFSLSSAVCVQLFARSHLISRETVDQNNAITQAQNLAEIWYAAEGNLDSMLPLLEGGLRTGDGTGVFTAYDRDWNFVGENSPQASYVAELTLLPDSSGLNLLHASVNVYSCEGRDIWSSESQKPDSEAVIYSLELSLHNAERRGSLE